MANVYAVKSGNWSDPTVWNTGSLPTEADDVHTNTYVVNIDVSDTVNTLRNTSATGINAGGYYELLNGVNFTCLGAPGIVADQTSPISVLYFSENAPAEATLNVRIQCGQNGNRRWSIVHRGSGTLNTIGDFLTGTSLFSGGIVITGDGTLYHVGNVRSCNNSIGGVTSDQAIRVDVTGRVYITGDVIAESYANTSVTVTTSNSFGVIEITGNVYLSNSSAGNNSSTCISGIGTTTVVGDITGTNFSTIVPVNLNSPAKFYHVGTLTAGLVNPAIAGTITDAFFSGPLLQSLAAINPMRVNGWRWYDSLTPTYFAVRDRDNTGYRNLYTADYTPEQFGLPIPADVRLGTDYGPTNELTGTLAVPPPENVTAGVPTDDTIGTAVISPTDLVNALVAASAITLNQPTSQLTEPGSLGVRLKNVATVQSTGDQIAAMNG